MRNESSFMRPISSIVGGWTLRRMSALPKTSSSRRAPFSSYSTSKNPADSPAPVWTITSKLAFRPAVKEQVESLGAKFAEMDLAAKDAEDKSGYAKAQSEEFYQKQQEMMFKYVAAADVVIPTALVPGQRAPILITEEMVRGMRPGSVIVDLAAEQGGNCALTEPGRDIVKHGVIIIGPMNLPSTIPFEGSEMYARTVTSYLVHLVKDGRPHLDLDDELTRGPLVTHRGEIVHEVVKARL